jgi:hypothetical protein
MSSASGPASSINVHIRNPPPFAPSHPAKKGIFEKLVELHQKSSPVTIERLIEELRTTKQLEAVDGVPYPNSPPKQPVTLSRRGFSPGWRHGGRGRTDPACRPRSRRVICP